MRRFLIFMSWFWRGAATREAAERQARFRIQKAREGPRSAPKPVSDRIRERWREAEAKAVWEGIRKIRRERGA